MDDTQAAIAELAELSFWDWELLGYDGYRCRVVGGNDLSYHWLIELVFDDVAYISIPTRFSHAQFHLPTAEEIELVTQEACGDKPAVVVAIIGDETPTRHLIGAEHITIVHGHSPRASITDSDSSNQ